MVHHGIIGRSRRIENIIDIMRHLPAHYSLDLAMVMPVSASKSTLSYFEDLKNMLPEDGRVRFIETVPMDQVTTMLHGYDVGIILFPPVNFNQANGLPNKLFDFIQARICILSGPTPEIANIVNSYKIGVISDDFTPESLAKKISSLSKKEINILKTNTDKAALEFSADHNKVIYNNIVRSLIG